MTRVFLGNPILDGQTDQQVISVLPWEIYVEEF